MDPRNASIAAYKYAVDYMINVEEEGMEPVDHLAAVIANFRKVADEMGKIELDQWTAKDFTRVMKMHNYVIQSILSHPEQNRFSAKEETGFAMYLYQLADHAKMDLSFFLAAYEASVKYAGHYADLTAKEDSNTISKAQYAEYAAQAKDIADKAWEAMVNSSDLPSNKKNRSLAISDAKRAYINLMIGNFGQALSCADTAVHGFGIVSDATVFDLYAISDIYRNLAQGFSFDPFYGKLFQFAADLFHGAPEATFTQLEEIIFTYQQMTGMNEKATDMLLQVMRLWRGKGDLLPDDAVFTQEMKSSYCQERFQIFVDKLGEREREFIRAGFASLENSQEELESLLKRADAVLAYKSEPLEEILALPTLDEAALPSPGLLPLHSIFKDDSALNSPVLGREIKVKFGPQEPESASTGREIPVKFGPSH